MKHLKIGTIGMVFIAMLFSINTFAQNSKNAQKGNNQGTQNRSTFIDFDSNNDGVITKIEFTKERKNRESQRNNSSKKMKNKKELATFESIDINNDGKITKTEFADYQTKRKNNRRK